MKKILLSVALLTMGLLAKANAGAVFTTTFTAVCVTSATDMELMSIEYSTGSSSIGDSFLLLFDTPSIYITNPANAEQVPLGVGFSGGIYTKGGRWPANQLFTPPIMLYSTASAVNGFNYNGITRIDFTDAQGNGRYINDALIGFKVGTDVGTAVTYHYRKRRTSMEH